MNCFFLFRKRNIDGIAIFESKEVSVVPIIWESIDFVDKSNVLSKYSQIFPTADCHMENAAERFYGSAQLSDCYRILCLWTY